MLRIHRSLLRRCYAKLYAKGNVLERLRIYITVTLRHMEIVTEIVLRAAIGISYHNAVIVDTDRLELSSLNSAGISQEDISPVSLL